jgi:tRNA dimethylallyltransferase
MLKSPVLAVVGPSASGKTALALQIAERFEGEIIAADSQTVYQGMDIGTAKPTPEMQQRVPHHLIDVCRPNQAFSAAEFKQLATEAVEAIQERHHLPVVVGGTGLYVDGLLYDYQFPTGRSSSLRTELERLPLEELVTRLEKQDPERAATIDLKNPRRVIRALETLGQPRIAPKSLSQGIHIVGINPGMEALEHNIATRTRTMLDDGLIAEVQGLLNQYDAVIEPLRSIGYAETVAFLNEVYDERELERLINLHTRQLAKRQLTWFKRNPDIYWVESIESGLELAEQLLKPQV